MIASLHGTLIYADAQCAVVECGGVGFRLIASLNTLRALPPVGREVFLHTHLVVREDAMELYGFSDLAELECFKLVTSVNGVGARIGIALLSDFTADQLALCVVSGDAKALTRASGVGIKLAQRIVLELKDKIAGSNFGDRAELEAVGNATASGIPAEAISALVALGFSQSEASLAVGRLDPSMPVEQMIKEALKQIARQV